MISVILWAIVMVSYIIMASIIGHEVEVWEYVVAVIYLIIIAIKLRKGKTE